jgi:hypothetical protein
LCLGGDNLLCGKADYRLGLRLSKQSRQYTGRPWRGSNGTSVVVPQSAQTAWNIWRVPVLDPPLWLAEP